MKIHLLASTPQYARHARAVWKHLPGELQGLELLGRNPTSKRLPPDDVVIVGGFYDIGRVPQRMIYVEHGAGQAYHGDGGRHPSYHGASHPERVIGYISPNQRVADSWGRPAFAAGCPALDEHAGRVIEYEGNRDLTAAITFHFDARGVCPEAWSAREHYLEYLHNMVDALRRDDYTVIGHWHPRDTVGVNVWKHLQIEPVGDPDEVLRRAHLLVADNTSMLYEAAQLGIASVVLNAPWYRRDVEHGLRFWDHIPGVQVETFEQFCDLDLRGYGVLWGSRDARASSAAYAYALRPGTAGEQAAEWVVKLLGEAM